MRTLSIRSVSSPQLSCLAVWDLCCVLERCFICVQENIVSAVCNVGILFIIFADTLELLWCLSAWWESVIPVTINFSYYILVWFQCIYFRVLDFYYFFELIKKIFKITTSLALSLGMNYESSETLVWFFWAGFLIPQKYDWWYSCLFTYSRLPPHTAFFIASKWQCRQKCLLWLPSSTMVLFCYLCFLLFF